MKENVAQPMISCLAYKLELLSDNCQNPNGIKNKLSQIKILSLKTQSFITQFNILMISYNDDPVCSVTNKKSTLFCFSDNCTRPAFACSEDCFRQAGHYDHKTAIWSDIKEEICQLIELQFAKEELMVLEKQQQQLQAITQQLRIIQANHKKTITECKNKLQQKDILKKVISAIQNKSTNSITGSDMAHLIKGIKSGNMFENKQQVSKATEQSYQLINQLFNKLKTLIDEYKMQEKVLISQDHISNGDTFNTKLKFTVDIENSEKAIVDNGIATVQIGNGVYHPVFACQQLFDKDICNIDIVDAVNRNYLIGVATSDLRNRIGEFDNSNSLCIRANGTLFSDANRQQLDFKLETNDKVSVRLIKKQIEWLRDGQLICAAHIPNHIVIPCSVDSQ